MKTLRSRFHSTDRQGAVARLGAGATGATARAVEVAAVEVQVVGKEVAVVLEVKIAAGTTMSVGTPKENVVETEGATVVGLEALA